MNIDQKIPPREFRVGKNSEIRIKDSASITLGENEQVTFTNEGKEFDVCKKKWGFYATPSTNRRLKSYGYLTCICVTERAAFTFWLSMKTIKKIFFFISQWNMKILSWLDDDYIIQKEKDLS